MRRYQPRSRWLLLLCTVFALLTANCGGGENHEVVYLHVFNAYPGSQSLSLYGPTGAVVTELPFGERTDEPVAVDRNLGTNFELILDGAPTTFDVDQQLFNLYPQETGTFLISRRQDNTAHAQILRHVQSISAGCRLVFHNSLAVSNDQIGIYHFIVGWNFHNTIEAFYNQIAEDNFIANNEDDLDAQHIENHEERVADIYEPPAGQTGIHDHPVFILAETHGDDEEDDPTSGLNFVWLGNEDFVGGPRVDFESGSVRTRPPTEEYLECLQETIEAQEAIAAGIDDAEVQEDATQDCTEETNYTTPSYGPGGDQVGSILHYYPESLPPNRPLPAGESADQCGADLRLYSDFANIFEGEPGHDDRPAFMQGGTPLSADQDPLIRLFPSFTRSDHQFYVLYGRAIDPKIEQWRSSEQFHDMEPYPGQ